MTELRPAAPQLPNLPRLATRAPPAAEGDNPYATVYERGGARLVVSFDFGHVELSVGQEVMIGRDATDQQLARLDDMMNVSRRHATIGLAPHGAWVRDENSTNGTFVNGRPVEAGETADLAEGAELRLASDVRATVRFRSRGIRTWVTFWWQPPSLPIKAASGPPTRTLWSSDRARSPP